MNIEHNILLCCYLLYMIHESLALSTQNTAPQSCEIFKNVKIEIRSLFEVFISTYKLVSL